MEEEVAAFERPDRKVLKIWVVSSFLSYAFLTFLIGVFVTFLVLRGKAGPTLLILPLSPMLLWALTSLFLKKTWERWGFRVTPRTVEIRKGLVFRSYRIVARNRIQHIDINSGPLDRRFGLVQVVIYTAGTVVGMIPGLLPERAEALRLELSASMEPKPPVAP